MLGKLLDRRYQVTQVLGAGGFGRTYLAQDTRRPGNPICVVKQLKPLSNEPSFLETARRLFNSEAETLEKLGNHDQIPRLLAYFEEDQEFYLVQEFIEGHTFSQELQPGQRWDENRVIALLQEVLKILEFVHFHGVIHRDVKPDNLIRRNSDNKLVLVDFGAVKQIRTQFAATQGGASNTIAVGTPGYMSSEQAIGQPRPSSDIYSLGIIGIQALTGLMPVSFQEDLSTGEILWEHLVSVSRGLTTILSKMVRYHFKDRYQSTAEVLQALQLLNTSSPTTPYFTPPRYPSVNDVPASGQRVPASTPPALGSEQYTLPATPASPPRNSAASLPRQSSARRSNNVFPLLISMMVVVVGAFGIAYAMTQSSLISNLKGGNKNKVIDASQRSCTVTAEALNVRSGPGRTRSVVNTVSQGTKLSLTGTEQNGWVEISSPLKGWVFNDQPYIDCSSGNQTPVQAKVTPTPVKTPTPKPSIAKPKPKPPVDNSSDTLTKAADQYQQGDLDKAIAFAKSIPANSPAYKEAQAKIAQWEQEWSTNKAKFDELQKALNEGRWNEVFKAATDPNFLGQRYWRDKLNQLIEEAKKKQAEADATKKEQPKVEPSTSGQTLPEQPKPQPTESVNPSPEPTQPTQPTEETTKKSCNPATETC
ncbi:MAG TPA: protein kinase [Coleofasciculaceae cyanobacterium]|jgi:serine/threonine-protein kinase